MASALDASVTLEDVFAVVSAKRVPLAPELAGYLLLEIVDGADPAGGEIDPKSVFIGDEGTVALVRPKRDSAAEDAEASARALLARLLEASGSQTPALGATARRRSGAGLRALGTEIESALIPVNRAAGRRALARLAREVKRVTQGVGRNASAPAPRREEPKGEESFDDEARTRAKVGPTEALKHGRPAPPQIRRASASLPRPPAPAAAPAAPAPAPVPQEPTPPPVLADTASATPPPARGALPKVQAPKPRTLTPIPPKLEREPAKEESSLFAGDEVDNLLATFEVSSLKDDKGVSHDLKELVGLEPTPPPPEAKDLARMVEAVVGKKEPVPVPAPSAPLLPLSLPAEAEASNERPRSLADALEPLAAPNDGDGGIDELLGLGDDDAATPGLPPSEEDPTRRLGGDEPAPKSTTVPAPPAKLEPAPKRLPAVSRAADLPRRPEADAPRSAPASAPTSGDGLRLPDVALEPPRAPRTSLALGAMALVVLAAGAGAIYKFFPDFFAGKGHGTPTPSAASSAPPSPPAAKCKATVIATDVPNGAEVLWRVGQAPADVERMPVGRLEFVATAEGFAPKRAVVPAGAAWDTGPDGKPRFELGVQLDPAKKAGVVEPWPPGEPGAAVGGNGAPGTVHLVSTPRGAEVWLLVGLGPEARVERLKCDADVDVLVAGPGAFRKRLHATAADIEKAPLDEKETRIVRLSAK